MSRAPTTQYGGYYTGKPIWKKEGRWGDLVFNISRSWLGDKAEGGAFRKNHKLYVTTGGGTSRTIVTTEGSPRYEGYDVAGHVSFIPANHRNEGIYQGKFLDCVSLEIPPEWAERFLDGHTLSAIEFIPATNRFDPLIYEALVSLEEEMAIQGSLARLFADAVASMVTLQLLRRYSNLGGAVKGQTAGSLAAVPLARTIEFIEANLGSELSLDELAGFVGMPVSSFLRAFRKATGMTPHRFVMVRRIKRARELLSHTLLPIADISYRMGFSSQSHFSTVFHHHVGASPARFRRLSHR